MQRRSSVGGRRRSGDWEKRPTRGAQVLGEKSQLGGMHHSHDFRGIVTGPIRGSRGTVFLILGTSDCARGHKLKKKWNTESERGRKGRGPGHWKR